MLVLDTAHNTCARQSQCGCARRLYLGRYRNPSLKDPEHLGEAQQKPVDARQLGCTLHEGPRTPSAGPRAEVPPAGAVSRARHHPLPSLHEPNRKTLFVSLEKQTPEPQTPALNNELLPPSGRGRHPSTYQIHPSLPPRKREQLLYFSTGAVTWEERTWAGSSILLLLDQQLMSQTQPFQVGAVG